MEKILVNILNLSQKEDEEPGASVTAQKFAEDLYKEGIKRAGIMKKSWLIFFTILSTQEFQLIA